MKDEDIEAGWWFGYFLVRNLRPAERPYPLADLRLWAADRPPAPNFIPEGPTIVEI